MGGTDICETNNALTTETGIAGSGLGYGTWIGPRRAHQGSILKITKLSISTLNGPTLFWYKYTLDPAGDGETRLETALSVGFTQTERRRVGDLRQMTSHL